MNEQKNTWTVVVALIVIAAIAGGIYWWQSSSKNQNNMNTSDFSAPKTNEVTTNNDDQKWTTYKDDKNGYEIQFPSTWEKSSENVWTNKQTPSEEVGVTVIKNEFPNVDIWTWAEKSDWPMTKEPKEYFQEITVGGVKALKDPAINTIHIVKGDKYYIIENGIGMERNVVNTDLYYKIVGTFKFTN